MPTCLTPHPPRTRWACTYTRKVVACVGHHACTYVVVPWYVALRGRSSKGAVSLRLVLYFQRGSGAEVPTSGHPNKSIHCARCRPQRIAQTPPRITRRRPLRYRHGLRHQGREHLSCATCPAETCSTATSPACAHCSSTAQPTCAGRSSSNQNSTCSSSSTSLMCDTHGLVRHRQPATRPRWPRSPLGP